MLDAFIYHVEHKLPWPMTEWEAYSRRSHRWRQQIKKKTRGLKRTILGFPDTLNQHRRHHHHPLTTFSQINDAGLIRHDCLGSQDYPCQKGNKRIHLLK